MHFDRFSKNFSIEQWSEVDQFLIVFCQKSAFQCIIRPSRINIIVGIDNNKQLLIMFLRTAYRYGNFFKQSAQTLPQTPVPRPRSFWWTALAIPTFGLAYYAFMPGNLLKKKQKNWKQQLAEDIKPVVLQPPKSTIWTRLWSGVIHLLRFIQLFIIFTPTILLSPLLLFKKTEDYWLDLFVKAVERSGVVFIKAFQYLSHRRDIIGPELAHKFEYLRQNAPTHSFETTREYFRVNYNRNIEDIFDSFESVPIASGSVSQVYRAVYKGKKVAVKVRHPDVDKHIQRDVNILFFFSYLASFFSPALQIPVSENSLKKTLTDQINFIFEMKNLERFKYMFRMREDVDFPTPFQQGTKDSVLVEQFVEGLPITYFENNRHKLNKVIAKLGTEVLFEMLMKNNFVHADCHGGNILITAEQKPYNFFTEVWDYLKDLWEVAPYRIKAETLTEERIKQVYLEYCKEELQIRKLIRGEKQKIKINLIDAGMVVELDQNDKRNFSRFIKSIIECRGNDAAEMIFNLSNFEGQKITRTSKFEGYHKQLSECFGRLNNSTYSQLEGMVLLWDMMRIIRENKMKLDGQFATLLTNIIVLEGIGRSLDPDINFLKCAFPYFKYIDEDPKKETTKNLLSY